MIIFWLKSRWMRSFIIFIFSILSFLSFSQKDSISSALLWSISGNGMKTSYLFGTIHLIPTNQIILTKQFTKLISTSDKIVLELDKLPSQTELVDQVQLKNGSLFDYFSEQQTDSILIWSKEIFNLSPDQSRNLFGPFRPIFLAQLHLQTKWMGKTSSYEEKIIETATSKNIPILGLETITDQLNFLDRIPINEQVELVMEEIRQPEKCLDDFDTLVFTYLTQNLNNLERLFHSINNLSHSSEDALLKERNTNWLPKITALLTRKDQVFIAVGAAHLIGKDGLIEQLRKLGYTLTPIRL